MKTIYRYVTGGFLATFTTTLLVVTFIMSLGAIFKVTELLAKGASWLPVAQIFAYSIPFALGFAIPISALVSSLLIFGALSADGEIMAMRACGLSLWQIIRGPMFVASVLACLCLFINSEMAPAGHLAQRSAIARLGMESPIDLFEEGRFIHDIPGMKVYVGKKKKDKLYNIRIYDARQRGVKREVLAKSGTVGVSSNKANIVIDLFDVRIEPFLEDRPGAVYCERWPIEIENVLKTRYYNKKQSDMSVAELFYNSRGALSQPGDFSAEERRSRRSSYLVELNERIVLSLATFAFVLLGIPLGIKAHRKESSVGVAISLFLVFNFYLFLIIAESLARNPAARPHLIAWAPIIISVALGYWLARRAN